MMYVVQVNLVLLGAAAIFFFLWETIIPWSYMSEQIDI